MVVPDSKAEEDIVQVVVVVDNGRVEDNVVDNFVDNSADTALGSWHSSALLELPSQYEITNR